MPRKKTVADGVRSETLHELNSLRESMNRPRVGVSELARSRGWRDTLKESGVLEVVDYTETVCYIFTPEKVTAMMDTMDALVAECDTLKASAAKEQALPEA